MTTNERILAVAFSQIGVSEIVGADHNPQVVRYFAETGHSWVKDDETAWCAAFANWVCLMAKVEATKKLNARSFLDIGTPVEFDQAEPGDVVILWRNSPTASTGHVTFFVEHNLKKTRFRGIGGNQTNRVETGEFSKDRVLGVRRLNSTPF
jgi:uncharacterized protein (TIGR02594 family)